MRTLYLAGPINACTDAEAKDWREDVKQRLADRFTFLDPMARDYRGKEAESVNEIVRGDMSDIECSDVILAFCPKPSVGTSMEIFYACWVLGKKVVTVVPSGPVSPWLRRMSFIVVDSLDGAVLELRRASEGKYL